MTRIESKKLFGLDKWEVEQAADNLSRTSELKTSNPKLYNAALKLLNRRQNAIGKILRAAKKSKGIN